MNERSKRTIKLKDRDTVATIDIYFNQDNTFELHVSFPIPLYDRSLFSYVF